MRILSQKTKRGSMRRTERPMRRPVWEAVSIEGGGVEVRAKFGSVFYTIADVYCTPDCRATENAELIATALNLRKRLVNTRRAD
jgi:hypothetical protein